MQSTNYSICVSNKWLTPDGGCFFFAINSFWILYFFRKFQQHFWKICFFQNSSRCKKTRWFWVLIIFSFSSFFFFWKKQLEIARNGRIFFIRHHYCADDLAYRSCNCLYRKNEIIFFSFDVRWKKIPGFVGHVVKK